MVSSMVNFAFRMMALELKVRDAMQPRAELLQEVPLRPGSRVLDFGCGPGSYAFAAAERVGPTGKVLALDTLPIALQYVQDGAFSRGLSNIETIHSDCATHLPDGCMDFIFLFDIFHLLKNPEQVLAELQRVLKPNGILCVNDHHLRTGDIITRITLGRRFKLKTQGKYILQFGKI